MCWPDINKSILPIHPQNPSSPRLEITAQRKTCHLYKVVHANTVPKEMHPNNVQQQVLARKRVHEPKGKPSKITSTG